MKSNIGAASIIKGTNRLISSTYGNESSIRVGSFIKFTKDLNNYIVGSISPLFYLVEFKKIGDRQIEVNVDTGININPLDTVTLSFKEYEIQTVTDLVNGGKNYQKGDVLNIDGGKVYSNIRDNLKHFGKIKVESIDENGTINRFSIADNGRYYSFPDNPVKLLGGHGEFALVNLQFKNCDKREVIERDVEKVQFDGQKTTIFLNYNIPPEIEVGKVGVDKFEITLTSSYLELSKINDRYEVTRDFTPYLNLPLMSKNSLIMDVIFNQVVIQLDKKIKDLDEKIAQLTK